MDYLGDVVKPSRVEVANHQASDIRELRYVRRLPNYAHSCDYVASSQDLSPIPQELRCPFADGLGKLKKTDLELSIEKS